MFQDCTGNGNSVDVGSQTSHRLTGLTPHTLYCVAVTTTVSSNTGAPISVSVTTLEAG